MILYSLEWPQWAWRLFYQYDTTCHFGKTRWDGLKYPWPEGKKKMNTTHFIPRAYHLPVHVLLVHAHLVLMNRRDFKTARCRIHMHTGNWNILLDSVEVLWSCCVVFMEFFVNPSFLSEKKRKLFINYAPLLSQNGSIYNTRNKRNIGRPLLFSPPFKSC